MAEHWCKEHKKPWFKKGKMRGYAHPIVDEEGESTGEWCNEPTEKPPATGKSSEPKSQPEMTKNDWAERDRNTRKSIERQTSLNAAVEVAKLMGAEKAATEKIIATAKRFEEYLGGKEVKSPKDKLVEEAKKLGAVEIEEEENSDN